LFETSLVEVFSPTLRGQTLSVCIFLLPDTQLAPTANTRLA